VAYKGDGAKSAPGPWRIEDGYDPWQGLVGAEWTHDQYSQWLHQLSPRMLVLHIQRWSLLAQAMPELSDELHLGIADARGELQARECVAD
jgi:hypothetical protein